MALAPLDRPASSTQVLRFRGPITVSQVAAASYPKPSAETPSDSVVTGTYFDAYVRFPLFKTTTFATSDMRHKLPLNVYDDEAPAGVAPHAPVASTALATAINATDLSMNLQSWAQNLEINWHELPTATPLVLFCDSAVSQDNNIANGALVVEDTLTSGLGLGSGMPVVIVHFRVLADDGALQTFNVDIEFEIRHSNHR